MKKTKTKVEKKTHTVEKYKCDDCGATGQREDFNVLALDPEVIEHKERRHSNDTHDWGKSVPWTWTESVEISPEEHLDLCDDCLGDRLGDAA